MKNQVKFKVGDLVYIPSKSHKVHKLQETQEFAENNLNNGWISVDELPDDESKDDYLVYSIHTKVYEKVDIEKLKMMINNSAKITHWQPMPQTPKE